MPVAGHRRDPTGRSRRGGHHVQQHRGLAGAGVQPDGAPAITDVQQQADGVGGAPERNTARIVDHVDMHPGGALIVMDRHVPAVPRAC